jgi:hypothetical protein
LVCHHGLTVKNVDLVRGGNVRHAVKTGMHLSKSDGWL